MSDYISKEKIMSHIESQYKSFGEDYDALQILGDIEDFPTEQRPHGEWLSHYDYCKKHEYLPTGLITFWWCNQCEQGVEIATNFCPNCGASMSANCEQVTGKLKEGEAE